MPDERLVGRRLAADRLDDAPDLEAELRRELEVALVVGRDGHDRAGAVAGQDVVSDEDRDPLAIDGIDGVGSDRHGGVVVSVSRPEP